LCQELFLPNPFQFIIYHSTIRLYWNIRNWQFHWVTHSKDHCDYSAHKVFWVFISRCLVAASNGGRCPPSEFPNCSWPQLQVSHFSWLCHPTHRQIGVGVIVTGCSPSISSSCCKAPWGSRPEFFFATQPLRS
jgi:hypothetical protein